MPGLILYKRRWSMGSDDLLIPALILAVIHLIWLITLIVYLSVLEINKDDSCQIDFFQQLVGYLGIWLLDLGLELAIIFISTRGSVFNDVPRSKISVLIYLKQVMWIVELSWCATGVIWIHSHYTRSTCSMSYKQKNIILGLVICNLVGLIILVLVFWCSYDSAGRSWLKLKKFQERAAQNSGKFKESRYSGIHRRSGGASRNWRHRQVRRQKQEYWDMRCRMLFCCARRDNKSKTSFAEIARLLSEFFRDLDVVPTDVLVGLVLLRKRQQAARQRTISQPTNNVYDFLSGVKVTPETKFVALNNPKELDKLRETVHYMYFALAAYGWPMYLLHNKTVPVHKAAWRLASGVRCCKSNCCESNSDTARTVLEDNCCMCNYSALRQVCLDSTEIVYVTYHVEVGETPFFIGVDFDKQTIVISIRGTLSIQDILTDLNAESEILPLQPMDEEMKGHKGMVHAAGYIYRKLMDENLLDRAFNWNIAAGTQSFPLVCVGHSLGGGTAAILTILLRQHYPNTTCYAYSPPGGLLSEKLMIASKDYMTSVVMGKDVVPRLGLHQMETLRHELIATVRQSKENKWKTLSKGFLCGKMDSSQSSEDDEPVSPSAINVHPLDSSINLSVHQPLYPPGNIIHIVRHHPNDKKYAKNEPIYQAVWADNYDFDQVLISGCMVQDHMPDMVLDALEKATRTHAWHAVYTSKTICGPTVEAAAQDKDDGDGDPHPDAMHHTDVDVDNVVTNQPKTVATRYERILHNNLYTLHQDSESSQDTEQTHPLEDASGQRTNQYVHVQHGVSNQELTRCHLDESPKRSQISNSSSQFHTSKNSVKMHKSNSAEEIHNKILLSTNKVVLSKSGELREASQPFIHSVRTSNQNFHTYLKIQNKSQPNNDLETIPAQNNHPISILSTQKNSTVLQTNSEHQTVKFSQGNSDILKATKREVTFNFTEDIYINSDQCKIIVEQKNGCLKDPLASVSRTTQNSMKYEATTTSNYNVQNNLESVSTKFANRQDQLDPSTTHNRQNTEPSSLLNQSLPELFNIVQEQLEADLLNNRLSAVTSPTLLLKPCHSSSDLTEHRSSDITGAKAIVTSVQPLLGEATARSRHGGRSKDFSKIRTPSDIFSFYDISHEEATTV